MGYKTLAVYQNPIGVIIALDMNSTHTAQTHSTFNLIANGLNLGAALTGTNQEVVGEGAGFLDVHHNDIERILFDGSENGIANFRV